MSAPPKYSSIEIERRWLVDLAAVGDLADVPYREIEDLYVDDSRLRLRKVTDSAGVSIFKFGKKYGKRSSTAEPATSLYLTELEYRRLRSLPGVRSAKRRYSVQNGALDVYREPRPGLAIFEMEFDNEAAALAYRPPSFVTREVTTDVDFSGVSIAGAQAIGDQMEITLHSVITCPECGATADEEMPTDACIFFYECKSCGKLLRPLAGDCCVFCSFGSVKCPPVQLEKGCCARGAK